ncbi:MAG: TonB-dependent receptor [Pseudomonadota bacterium]
MITFKKSVLATVVPVVLYTGVPVAANAQETSAQADNEVIEEIVAIGTRGKPRSVSDSPVPVDVISSEEFTALGGSADLTDNLKALIPSYTATPATGDGSAFVRPTSLRGTAPDQTLVLVNGKRRHRSALVQFFAPAAGNGAHGVDVGMIPSIALERVEVLRDGAAAQYGSDAIAGVINFVTKTDNEGGEVQLRYGQHFEGEDNYKLSANAGIGLGSSGFANFSLEYTDNEALSRGIQRPDAQALTDSGITSVGLDAPFGDTPLVQTWGRPETKGLRLFLNAGADISSSMQWYGRVGYADTDGRYRFFYRNPQHSSIAPLRAAGFDGLLAGYTPYLDGAQTDLSLVTGLEGEFNNGMLYDFSVNIGRNELDYFLNNTLNPDLGLVNGQPAQRNFNVGGYEQEELTLNADFSLPITDSINLAFGAEWRDETYTAIAGEPNSYQGAGSNGFKGITPQDSGEFSRDNFAIYADLEHDITDAFLLQYALRYENFSDFGGTTNGKIAALYRVNDRLAFRGAVSTGFHAPTPGQSNVRTTITTFDGRTGLQVEEGLVPSTDPRVASVGGTELKEEESFNISAGLSADLTDNTTVTLDFYKIEVDDRIYRTGDIAVPGTTNTISFYTNALDVEHQGVDLVITSALDWNDSVSTNVTLAYNYGEIDVVGQSPVGGVNPVSEGLVEDIENNYPENRFVLTTNTLFNPQWNLLLRATYYGDHFDERGRIGAASDPSAEIDATIYIDLELGYQASENFRVVLGGMNIFDEFIDEIGPPNANRLSVGLQYPRRTAANYEGGSWYLKGTYTF